MAFRTFVDATGREWQVYDVVPPSDERRRNDRRGDVTPDRIDEVGVPNQVLRVWNVTALEESGLDAYFHDPNLRIVQILLKPFAADERPGRRLGRGRRGEAGQCGDCYQESSNFHDLLPVK